MLTRIAGWFLGGGYSRKTVWGVGWMAVLRTSMRLLAVLKLIVLARFLTPSQFGIYGVALIVLGFLEIVTETGVNVVLIQEEEDIDDFVSTAWIVSMARGAVIAGLIFALAPIIGWFFAAPTAAELIRFTALIPLVRGLINPAIVKFQKQLVFRKEFWFRLAIYATDLVVAIGLGILTRSEYALIWAMLAAALVEVVISFAVASPRPVLRFNLNRIKKVVDRGKWITAAGTLEYLFQHLDDIAVGRLLGAAPLGLYQQAYRISTLPTSEVGEVFNKVTFPIYAQIADDKQRLRRAFLKITAVITFLLIPFGAALFVLAEPAVILLLGQQWFGAVSSLKVLAIFGVVKALSTSTYALFLALRRQELVAAVALVNILALAAPLIFLIHRFGLAGAGLAAVIGVLAGLPLIVFHLDRVFRGRD